MLSPLWREVDWFEVGATLGGLASSDMEPVIANVLSALARDTDHEVLVQFVLTLLWEGSSPAVWPRICSPWFATRAGRHA